MACCSLLRACWARQPGTGLMGRSPEPVLAMPMQSLPDMITGSACDWMGSGRSKPPLRSTSRMRPLSPHCTQEVPAGRGLADF
jgi:hypothetical protein